LYVKKQGVEAGGELTNLQACQSFRRLVSPKTGILGIKKSAPWNKRKQTVSSDASPTQQTPSKSSICALYLATLIPQIGLLSVQYRTNRRMTPIRTDLLVNAPCNRLSRKLYAGNPHVRFDEGEDSSRTLSTLLRDSLIFLEPRAPSKPNLN